MEPVREIAGTAVPLRASDVDTDQIIPSDWLKRVERTGFGEGLFAAWRESSDFVLNQARYDGASVLVAGPNFGTGSSREHAVWALVDYGFQAVVSPRFADIFRNNATKNGLVPVEVDEATAEALLGAVEADPALEIVIDVEAGTVAAPAAGISARFSLDEAVRHRLLNGLDDISLSLERADDITAFESRRPSWLPTTTTPA